MIIGMTGELKTVPYLGMNVPEAIYSIITILTENLKKSGRYSESLDYQILVTSSSLYTYNLLLTRLIRGGNGVPKPTDISSAGESLRRQLQGLGIIVSDKKGVSAAETNNPLEDMLSNLSDDAPKKLIKKKS